MKTLTIGNLKARIPIIQGGMGVGISLSGLASAVANEGGIGVISAAGLGLLYKRPRPAAEITPIPPSFATAEAKPEREIPTPIPPWMIGMRAFRFPIVNVFM